MRDIAVPLVFALAAVVTGLIFAWVVNFEPIIWW